MKKCSQGCDAPISSNHPDWPQDDDMGLCRDCLYSEMECKSDELRHDLFEIEKWLENNK